MTPAARERLQIRTPLLIVSAAAWIALAFAPGGTVMHAHHNAHNPVALAAGWALMLAAMMAPLLIPPVRHVRDRSFASRRSRAVALFAAGYTAIWLAGGAIFPALALGARAVSPESAVPLALVTIIALVWQFSPVKQRCLNRCHNHSELAAFGRQANIDALCFGLRHGFWCAGSCWALMLLPLLVSRGHLTVMAAVSLWLFAERLDRPALPRWQFRWPGKALRLALARARLRLPGNVPSQ